MWRGRFSSGPERCTEAVAMRTQATAASPRRPAPRRCALSTPSTHTNPHTRLCIALAHRLRLCVTRTKQARQVAPRATARGTAHPRTQPHAAHTNRLRLCDTCATCTHPPHTRRCDDVCCVWLVAWVCSSSGCCSGCYLPCWLRPCDTCTHRPHVGVCLVCLLLSRTCPPPHLYPCNTHHTRMHPLHAAAQS